MMSVHLPIKPAGTFIWPGDLDYLKFIWVDWLGRASVASLSFVSGILLRRSLQRSTMARLSLRKAQTLYLPMVVWNIVFIIFAVFKDTVSGTAFSLAVAERIGNPLAAVLGVTGPTANLSLFFLRDLFVASVILMLTAPLIARFQVLAVVVVFVGAVGDAFEPILFRPNILLFALAGFIFDARGLRLTVLLRPAAQFGFVALGLVLILLATLLADLGGQWRGVELNNIGKRVLLVAALMAVCALIARGRFGDWCLRWAPAMFLVYLLHAPLGNALWTGLILVFGEQGQILILVNFFMMPLIALAAGFFLFRLLENWHSIFKVLLSGKERGTTVS